MYTTKESGMDIIELNGFIVTEQTIRFSAGEVQLKIPKALDLFTGKNLVKAHITTSDGTMLLAQLASLIEGQDNVLILPYLPYSRYDHREIASDPLSLKVFTNLLNTLGFRKVITHDCHSDVGVALVDNCINVPQHILVSSNVKNIENYDAIIAPDSGASKKAFKLSEKYKLPLIVCDKHREHNTGKIIGFSVPREQLLLESIDKVLMVDDIADGGGTFKGLAKELKRYVDTVDLHVTHGIFSRGKDDLIGDIDNVFCYHDWANINLIKFN